MGSRATTPLSARIFATLTPARLALPQRRIRPIGQTSRSQRVPAIHLYLHGRLPDCFGEATHAFQNHRASLSGTPVGCKRTLGHHPVMPTLLRRLPTKFFVVVNTTGNLGH